MVHRLPGSAPKSGMGFYEVSGTCKILVNGKNLGARRRLIVGQSLESIVKCYPVWIKQFNVTGKKYGMQIGRFGVEKGGGI